MLLFSIVEPTVQEDPSMRARLLAAAVMLAMPGAAWTRSATPSRRMVDQDYVLALAAADRFLCAWRLRDQDAGLALVSDRLKRRRGEKELRSYLSGLSNPHHAAFEVSAGRRLKDG